jgi:sulfopyruvate decarboxylase TPP-binding subunit
MFTEKESEVSGEAIAHALEQVGIRFVLTVPDWVQLPLHYALESHEGRIRTISCCSEHEAIMMAGGLYCGGERSAVVIQNQGLYAGLNALRGIGLDAGIPLVMLIGQFGREASNRGANTKDSQRRIVRMLDPLLDLLDIPTWRIDRGQDVSNIAAAYRLAEQEFRPVALVFERNMRWSS